MNEPLEDFHFDFTGFQTPSDEDAVHKPEFAPQFTVDGITANYRTESTISFSITASGTYQLSKVDVFINDVYTATSSNKPFVFSFPLGTVKNIQKENTVTITVYDSIFNKNSKTFSFSVSDI